MRRIGWALMLCLIASSAGAQERTPSPPDAMLYFISPADGATVTSPFVVRFGLSGMGVAPAGVGKAKTGHHHLIIDAPLPPLDEPVPSDEKHRHFGGGQTEVELDLPPGRHTLQLLLGDSNHIPHAPPVTSERITVTVQ
jgi:hypothetical protein